MIRILRKILLQSYFGGNRIKSIANFIICYIRGDHYEKERQKVEVSQDQIAMVMGQYGREQIHLYLRSIRHGCLQYVAAYSAFFFWQNCR